MQYMPATRPAKLIYDIGMHNGDDSAYYLHQGHRVVAVEADPSLVNEAIRRFSRPLETGQFIILNVALADHNGRMDFWINDDDNHFNSLDQNAATRKGVRSHVTQVETRSIGSMVGEFGIPYYLKVDIEGYDLTCINGLMGLELPKYISVECEAVEEGETLSDQDVLATLDALYNVGYRKFKLIAQADFWPLVGSGTQLMYRKIVRSAASGRLSRYGLKRIGMPFTSQYRLSKKNGYNFRIGSSGPWGEGTLGAWMGYEAARRAYLKSRTWHFRHGYGVSGTFSFWCDWHATF